MRNYHKNALKVGYTLWQTWVLEFSLCPETHLKEFKGVNCYIQVCGLAHFSPFNYAIMHESHSCTLICMLYFFVYAYIMQPPMNSYWFRELTTLYIWVIGLKHVCTCIYMYINIVLFQYVCIHNMHVHTCIHDCTMYVYTYIV